jgi:hypothetical protein
MCIEIIYCKSRDKSKMTRLKVPTKKLENKMQKLILDNKARDIKLMLFKLNKSIPALYHDLKHKLEQKNIFIAESTFKNMLSESKTQRCDLEKRKIIGNVQKCGHGYISI